MSEIGPLVPEGSSVGLEDSSVERELSMGIVFSELSDGGMEVNLGMDAGRRLRFVQGFLTSGL